MSQPKPMAELMPDTAEIVAMLRGLLGAERVDAALRASVRAERERHRLEGIHGPAYANAWLARQRFPEGRFHAVEGGREVGVRAC